MKKFPSIPTLLAVIFICVFFALAAFFALNLKREGLIPDENAHIALSQVFAAAWGVPPDGPQTYAYGPISTRPYLYYWINGRLLNALQLVFPEPGNWKILVTLRMASVVYSTLAVIFCTLLAKELIENRWWRLLAVFLLTSTLMFVFLSGGVNYDNLVNLCSFAGIYFWIRVLNGKPFLPNSLAWMVCALTGTLVKVTVLPLLAIMAFFWVFYIFRSRRRLVLRPVFAWRTVLLAVLFSGVTLLNAALYGGNLIRFKAITPSCTVVLSQSQCEKNPVFLRDQRAAEKFTAADMFNGNVPNPLEWLGGFWLPSMAKMIYGIIGSRVYFPSDRSITLYGLWFLWMLLLVVWYRKKATLPVAALAGIVLFYTLVLLLTNLTAELNNGFKHLGIQGRYFFPVIGALYVLLTFFAAQVPNKIIASATATAALALFFLHGPIWVLAYPAPLPFPSTRISPEEHTIAIGGEAVAAQDFVSECSGTITQVEVLFANPKTATEASTELLLTSLTGQQVITRQSARVPAGEQAWVVFPLPALQDTKDRPYRITLSAPESSLPLWLWNTQMNVYRGGDAIVQGVPTNKDLVFRYICRMPPLTDWFYSPAGS